MKLSRLEFEAIEAVQLAKLTRGQPQPTSAFSAVEKERELHAAILAECKRRGWIVFHGSMAHATFRTPGEPDFVCLAPPIDGMDDSAPRTFMIEAKTRTGKLSPDQRAIHAWAAKLGHTVHVVRSLAEFLEAVK